NPSVLCMDLQKVAMPDTSLRPKGGNGMSRKTPSEGQQSKVPNPLAGLTGRYGTILIDPPWRFANRTGKMAPEHKRLRRYPTLSFEEITALPVANHAKLQSHLYMWCPNALLLEGLQIMKAWGFVYKTNITWYKGGVSS